MKAKPRDINDTLREAGPDAVREFLDGAQRFTGGEAPDIGVPPLSFIDVGAWQGKPVPPQEWLVRDRIPHKNVTLLGGDGATGKTTIALQLCVATPCASSDWLGGVMEKEGKALFFSAEESDDEIHRRLAGILAHHGLTYSEVAKKFYPHCRPADDPILAFADCNGIIRPTPVFHRLQEAVADIRPTLVCIEAASDVFAGDENKRPQVRAFIALLRGQLAIRHHTAVVLLQHPSQAGMATGSGTSGSTAWNNSCRSRMYLATVRASADAEPDRDLRTLKVMKANYGPQGETIKLRWQAGVFVVEGGASPLDKLARDTLVEEQFLRLLGRFLDQHQNVSHNKGPTYAPAKFAHCEDAKGITSAEFDRAMQRLIDAGRVRIEKTGPPSRQRSSLALGTDNG